MNPMMTPDLRPRLVGGGYPINQKILTPKPSSLTPSSSPSTSPQLQDLSPSPFTPHVSIIQEVPGRSSASPNSQPSTPTDITFSPSHCMTVSDNSSQGGQRHPKAPERRDGSPSALSVSIKQEPQELDQMYLDDGEWTLFISPNVELCPCVEVKGVAAYFIEQRLLLQAPPGWQSLSLYL